MKTLFACLVLLLACDTGVAAEKVALIKVDGAIGPATASYISRSIAEAQAQQEQCLVIQLNTPGGLLDSTQKIVQSFLSSPVPVVVYVAPTGATATSAGCFITIAASLSAMAPATTIGAAHPVSLGGNPLGGDEQKPDDTMTKKLENFSVSYIETIAARRHRNVEWAKSAVKESASITAETLVTAAAMMSKEPIALQLRFLQTMREISSEHNTTTFFPVPIDLFALFTGKDGPGKL